MTELYNKSITKLELNVVLERLSEHAVSEEGKKLCRSLCPLNDADEIRMLQQQTAAACHLIEFKGTPAFSGIFDVSAILSRADRGGSLNPSELLRVAGLLRCAREVKSYCDGDYQQSQLDPLFFMLTANRYLEEKIGAAILSEDEIADAASSELATIRRHIRMQSAKIKEIFQKIISSPTYAKILQEPIVTMRSGRYVVPVKSESKSAFPGLTHDISSSGSTFFIEPSSAVEANNKLRELMLEEEREIDRILAAFSAEVAAHKEAILSDYQILVQLDGIFAKAKYAFDCHAIEPQIRTDGAIRLENARHPLIDRGKAVPICVRLGEEFDTLVITGPNTGGKTVTLKTLGLLTLMAECGLHIPVESGSYISVFETVLADIGDEQSIEQSLSTFSAHMKNIVEISHQCDQDSLILLDELGAGTDPTEGAALAISLIEFFRKMGSRVAATTHYAELKLYAMQTPGVVNAACEFDVNTLRPTYRLLIGLPGRSNAFAISARLGLSEEIIQSAKGLIDQNDRNFEEVLSQLEQERHQMESAREQMEQMARQAEQQKKKADEYYAEISREKEKAAERARAEAQRIIEQARRSANEVQEELKQMHRQLKNNVEIADFNEKQARLRRQLNEAQSNLAAPAREKQKPVNPDEVKPGDTVQVIKLGTKATVLSCNKDKSLNLQVGRMQITAKPEEVYLLEQSKPAKKPAPEYNAPIRQSTAMSPELDLRGMDSIEAIAALEQFLDRAVLHHLASVRIIHGKGTGVLRAAVQAELRRQKSVKSFRLGRYGEGENGVTIAELRI